MDIGYHPQIQGGIYGQPDLGDADPARQAALQELAMQANLRVKEGLVLSDAGYVPPGTGYGPSAPEWATQAGGPANLPKVGWTAQNSTGSPFGPYDDSEIGGIPDWTSDANSAGGGRWDQTSPIAYGDYNPLNQAPLGDAIFDGYMGVETNPNAPTTDVSGSVDLEW